MTESEFICALKRNKQRLFLIALSFTKNTYDSEEILQNVFMKLWKHPKSFTDEEHIDKWLTTVCVNESKNYIKLFFKRHEDIDSTEIVSHTDFESASHSALFNAVMELPKKERTVIHLFYYEDYSIKQISMVLDEPESTIKIRLKRGREKLAKMLRKEDWI